MLLFFVFVFVQMETPCEIIAVGEKHFEYNCCIDEPTLGASEDFGTMVSYAWSCVQRIGGARADLLTFLFVVLHMFFIGSANF